MKRKLETIAGGASNWIGSVESLIVHTIIFVLSFLLVIFGVKLDRVLLVLTTALSLEAIYLAIFIQMAVNQNTARLTKVENNIVEIADGVEEIADDVEDIQEDVEEMHEDVVEIQENVGEISKDIDEIQEDVESIEKDIDEIQEDVESIEKEKN